MTQEAGTPAGFWDRVEQIAKKVVNDYVRAGLLNSASISSGGLTIKGGFLRFLFPASLGSGLAAFFGDIKNEADGSYLGTGLLIQDQNGRDIAQLRTDDATGTTVIMLNDAQGNNVISTFNAPMGLSRPLLQGGFVPTRFADFTVATTSATFETLFRGTLYKQNPAMFVRTAASMDTSGTTGELRVLVNGNQLGSVATVGFTVGTFDFGTAVIAGAHMDFLNVEIQGRRTGATGALRVAPGTWIGGSL